MKFKDDRYSIYFGEISKNINPDDRDALKMEYELASKSLSFQRENQNKIISILILLLSSGYPVISYTQDKMKENQEVYLLLSCFFFLFSLTLILQVSDMNKQVFYNSQKIIIIRRILGLKDHYFHPILPSNSIEGARNPFEIKLLPYFLHVNVFQLILISTIGSSFTYLAIKHTPYFEFRFHSTIVSFIFLFLFSVKRHLLEHENLDQKSIKFFSKYFLDLKLEDSFGWSLYKAQLANNERKRLGIDTSNIKKMLLLIEDKRFYKHKGFSLLSIMRAILYRLFTKKRKSGASTITQQLVRTLFILEFNKKWRRKIVEILLSWCWLEKEYSKQEILDLYISSVRYAHKIHGIAAALNHFTGSQTEPISNAQAFVITERIANVKDTMIFSRINEYIDQAISNNEKIMKTSDLEEVFHLYSKLIFTNKINCSKSKLEEWRHFLISKYKITLNSKV